MKKLYTSIIVVTVIAATMISYSWIQTHGFHRPYMNWGIRDLAEHLVKNKLAPERCFDLVWYEIGMQAGDAKAECVYRYAELTKDPSACELLMPSSYGLSCVGGAEEHLPCDVTSIQYSVYWKDGDKENTESIKSCLLSNEKRTTLGNACCEVAKVAFLKENNDCSVLKNNRPVYDHCLYALAWKNKDPDICSDMTEGNPKAACIVQSTALKQDPSICQGCTQPLESIEDLE